MDFENQTCEFESTINFHISVSILWIILSPMNRENSNETTRLLGTTTVTKFDHTIKLKDMKQLYTINVLYYYIAEPTRRQIV